MSTWNSITIETTDGREIDPLELQLLWAGLGQHVEVDAMHDGTAWDYGYSYETVDGRSVMREDRTEGTADGHSKYSIDLGMGDGFGEFTKALGPGLRLTILEEWDDDDGGRSSRVYVNGEELVTESWESRPVSNALAGVDFTKPVVLAATGPSLPQGTRLLLLDQAEVPAGTETVVFQWSRNHGDCHECGLPAAFQAVDAYGPDTEPQLLCAVCAANAAADGETVERIEDLTGA